MQVYNTLSRKKEELVPSEPGAIKMYVCGPTTYNYIHLGNARPMVVFDTFRRYLEFRGYRVTYIQNFTDIDDKIINRAREEGLEPGRLAQKYIEEYFLDATALNVRQADIHPMVSRHLPDIVAAIECLIERGHAYEAGGDVYFRVRSFPGYGRLSGRSLDEMLAGARVEVGEKKRDPLDFALWKAARPGEPAWESPWGPGRPGWHIECSTMAVKYLGNNFDLHGGGSDLIFPHHENEIAQAESCSGEPFARYWVHNGFITINEEKMSKSLGNVFLVRELLERFPGRVIRYFLLSSHYRSPQDFDLDKLAQSRKSLERLDNTLDLLQEGLQRAAVMEPGPREEDLDKVLAGTRAAFVAAMDDDCNTALALGCLFEFGRELNSYLQGNQLSKDLLLASDRLFRELMGQVLGLMAEKAVGDSGAGGQLAEQLMQLILAVRDEARLRKDWPVADGIRDRLQELAIVIEDTPHGARWKRK